MKQVNMAPNLKSLARPNCQGLQGDLARLEYPAQQGEPYRVYKEYEDASIPNTFANLLVFSLK